MPFTYVQKKYSPCCILNFRVTYLTLHCIYLGGYFCEIIVGDQQGSSMLQSNSHPVVISHLLITLASNEIVLGVFLTLLVFT